MGHNLFGDNKCAVGLIFVCCALISLPGVNSCLNSGWECLLEDLIDGICPAIRSATTDLEDLLKISLCDEKPKCRQAIPKELLSDCLRCGKELSRAAFKRGKQLVSSGVNLEGCNPAMLHFFSTKLSPEMKKASAASNEMLAATKLLQMKVCSSTGVTPNTFMSFLENNPVCVREHIPCTPVTLTCCKDKYRTMDGSCNNKDNPGWGRKNAPFTRIATPRYSDGIYAMPLSTSGRQLPNSRALSVQLFSDLALPSRTRTYLNMQWGQFLTHDIVYQIMESTDEGPIQCCVGEGQDVLPTEYQNDKCIPICVSDNDPFYRRFGIRCLNFVRSVTTPRDDCSLGYAEQMTIVTSYVDGSQVYGSDKSRASKLRSYRGGRLKEETRLGQSFCPSVDDKAAVCHLRNMSEPCYIAGDGRINQSPPLAALHTLLLREHNRVADILSCLNPLWTDEKIYQEARRICIAEMQHITYQEWLPLNFGEQYFRYYRISPSTLYSYDYDSTVNPGMINEFGAAAFRFLHSIIPDAVMTCPEDYRVANFHKLSDHYYNPGLLEISPSAFDDLIRGIIGQSCAESDPYCSGEITNLLFKSHNKWGMDLIAMDIQRGRDHGLAGYNVYREICGLKRANTFQDLAGEIPRDQINVLARMYETVDDIDLFVGGALECPVPGSILGHTFQCIVAEQFYRLRVGDRYFYDHSEMPHSFTPEQLQEIKKASMARLICDNTDVKYVQRRVFEMESPYNPKYSCADYNAIPRVDLMPWKER